MMIGPTSDTAKAMMQSLTQQIQMGMPVDQAIQYVKSQAVTGVAPLVDLYALLNQFERMKQPQKQMPVGGTIKQQLDNVESLAAGQPSQAMMGQGLGALNAGAMEDPVFSAAGGGIVAFDEGGVTAANVKKPMPKSWEEVREQAALGSEESIEDLEKDLARQEEIEKRLGIGRYAPSRGLKEAEAERKRKALQQSESEMDELDREKFYADVAEIGSEAGTRETKAPTFLTALSKAKARQLERKEKKIERTRTAEDAFNASKIAMAEADEALAGGDLTRYRTKVAEAKRLRDEATQKIAEGTQKREEDKFSRETQLRVARTQQDTPLARQQERVRKMDQSDPNYPKEVKRLRDMEKASGTAGGIPAGVQGRLLGLYSKAYDKVLNAYGDEEREAAQKELDEIGDDLAELGIPIPGMGGRGEAASGGPAPPTPGQVVEGYRFKGGNAGDPANWEKVG
jgi:hypothetical protein